MDPGNLKVLLEICRPLNNRVVRVRLVIGTLCHLPVQLLHLLLHPLQVGEREGRLFPYGKVVAQRHLLREVAYGSLFRDRDNSTTGRLYSRHNLKEGRFSRSVLTGESHPLVPIQYERDPVEQREATKLHGEVFYREHSEASFISFTNSSMSRVGKYFCSPFSMFRTLIASSLISFSPTSATKGMRLLLA